MGNPIIIHVLVWRDGFVRPNFSKFLADNQPQKHAFLVPCPMHPKLMVKKSARDGPDVGFDADADYIPLDLSVDINHGPDVDTSQASLGVSPFDANVRGPPASSSLNGHPRKRKRSDVDTYPPERGPSVQRRRVEDGGRGLNPWQSSVDAYTYNETAKMYGLFPLAWF